MKAELKNKNGDPILFEEDFEALKIDKSQLFTNTSTRCPVVLLVDTSKSMSFGKLYDGVKPIDEVNKGLKYLYDYIKNDYICKKRCEIAVITFNNETTLETDFSPIEAKKELHLTANGGTYMGPALNLMMDIITERKRTYDKSSRNYYRPIVILLTDGGPSDPEQFELAKERIYQATKRKELSFYAVKVGVEQDINLHRKHFQMLQGFDNKNEAGLLDVANFKKFFVWLSRSISKRSSSPDTEDDSMASNSNWFKAQVDR